MTTKISELWAEMERDIADGKVGAAGWLLRLARPEEACPLFAAVELTSRQRAVLLRLSDNSIPPLRKWPRSKGLDPLRLQIDGVEHFGVKVRDERFNDVFAALAEDISRLISEATTPDNQSRAFFGQLLRWQKFLMVSTEGLTDSEQRGLWGELHFLRHYLLPVLGPSAVSAWNGPAQAHQDFQFGSGAIEVKTTLAKQPQIVRITSERQLDHSTWPTLILHVIALDVRDGGGEALPAMIRTLRLLLATDPAARDHFEDCLLLAGYLEAHSDRYLDRGYLIRSETSLRVKRGFPVLAESDMPAGVGDVSYGLAVAACSTFSITAAALKENIAEMAKIKKQRQRSRNV